MVPSREALTCDRADSCPLSTRLQPVRKLEQSRYVNDIMILQPRNPLPVCRRDRHLAYVARVRALVCMAYLIW